MFLRTESGPSRTSLTCKEYRETDPRRPTGIQRYTYAVRAPGNWRESDDRATKVVVMYEHLFRYGVCGVGGNANQNNAVALGRY
jgi:hypothetical protein